MTTSPPDHDDLPHRPGRVHITARQRWTDITALGSLALHLPHVAASLAVVFLLSYALASMSSLPWWLLFGCWVLSGALVFHRPCERLMARWLFRLRYPTPDEDGRLRPVWREVTARAGVDADAYQLWIEESDAVNAMAAAGHIVGVTSHSLRTLTPGQLAGVLAHELGHHTRGHAWASLLSLWYALPARLAWRLLLRLATRLDRLPTGTAAVVIGVSGAAVVALATATYGLIFLPLATPYLVAAVARRSELRADEHAAGLGFAPQLMAVLHQERDRAESRRVPATAPGTAFTKEGMIARLLDSHPDVHTRLHHLQAHVESKH
ncbi:MULTISPECIES: M48 family metalloprotease [Streptomyces]|uniref:Heat shock protein HtpX n=1 Tax=Streptomyces chartreusis NRRL 3882 TaxID=1079985 RepID=A0A2N9B8U5_STRCX|nr:MULTISPECIES: M48 family metalloprotease [Streptomyces]MYS89500.1 M48 family metalloprotease [Streptomyces sp. SID5464]SOR79750.1 heat shock protein HtpX [Streptomyces chartreusis NRRL 3882]